MTELVAKSVDLLRAAQAGDDGALAVLCGRYEVRIRRLVHRRMNATLRVKADTNDLVHEVLLSVLANVDRIEVRDDRSFARWITRVVVNAVIDLARKPATEGEPAEPEAIADGRITTPPDRAIREEERRRTLAAIARLPEEQRRIVELRDFDDLSYAAIAKRMDRTEDAARMLHRRAVVRLTALLTEPEARA
jgi:RNA polymerase sigma-70 factor, ECF subfamily